MEMAVIISDISIVFLQHAPHEKIIKDVRFTHPESLRLERLSVIWIYLMYVTYFSIVSDFCS